VLDLDVERTRDRREQNHALDDHIWRGGIKGGSTPCITAWIDGKAAAVKVILMCNARKRPQIRAFVLYSCKRT